MGVLHLKGLKGALGRKVQDRDFQTLRLTGMIGSMLLSKRQDPQFQ
jgi:hypothetical protein